MRIDDSRIVTSQIVTSQIGDAVGESGRHP
jgi:hypothetical protein